MGTAGLLFPQETEGVPVCLQRIDRTKTVLAHPQKPVKEGVQNIDRDTFEGGRRVLFGKLAVSCGVDQILINPVGVNQGGALNGTKSFSPGSTCVRCPSRRLVGVNFTTFEPSSNC